MEVRGIDVSTWQNVTNWNAVKSSGIEFAMLRSSFGSASPNQIDDEFYKNVNGAKQAGVPIGAYHYGYAMTPNIARQEAEFFLDTIKGIQFEYPLAYDVEDEKTQGLLSRQELTEVVKAFCETVQNAGYYVMIYASTNWLENRLDMSQLPYDVWVAQYYKECQYNGEYGIWQYSSTQPVEGVSNYCADRTGIDVNISYRDYPKIIQSACLNGWGAQSGLLSKESDESKYIATGTCIADLLNVRVGPGIGYDVAFQVALGNSVNIIRECGNGWYYIDCLHGSGYCSTEYIQKDAQDDIASSSSIQEGDTVKIIGSYDVNGVILDDWVHQTTHVVSQVSNDGTQILLGADNGICSWLRVEDIQLT